MYPFVCLASKKVLRYVSICNEFLAKSKIFPTLSIYAIFNFFSCLCVHVIVFHDYRKCKQSVYISFVRNTERNKKTNFFLRYWLLSLCIFHRPIINYLAEAFITSLFADTCVYVYSFYRSHIYALVYSCGSIIFAISTRWYQIFKSKIEIIL